MVKTEVEKAVDQFVSIPYSTIKMKIISDLRVGKVVSIPYSTIKIYDYEDLPFFYNKFQFLIVRLKFATLAAFVAATFGFNSL